MIITERSSTVALVLAKRNVVMVASVHWKSATSESSIPIFQVFSSPPRMFVVPIANGLVAVMELLTKMKLAMTV